MTTAQTIDLNIVEPTLNLNDTKAPSLDLNIEAVALTPEKSKLLLSVKSFINTFKEDIGDIDVSMLDTMSVVELHEYYAELRDSIMIVDNKANNSNLLGIGCSGIETVLCKLNPYNKGVGIKLYNNKGLNKAFQVLMFERGSSILRNPWIVLISNVAGVVMENNNANKLDPTFVTDQDKLRKSKIDVNIDVNVLKKYKTLIE
jgi:hypothetical protein